MLATIVIIVVSFYGAWGVGLDRRITLFDIMDTCFRIIAKISTCLEKTWGAKFQQQVFTYLLGNVVVGTL